VSAYEGRTDRSREHGGGGEAQAAKGVVLLLGRTTIEQLRAAYPGAQVVRVQPNTPAEVGRGVTLLAEPADQPLAGQVEELFGRVGAVIRVPEGIIDAWAACSGAELLRAREHDTLRLRREVTSPGGTTARGLAALERGGVRAAFASAMDDVLGPA